MFFDSYVFSGVLIVVATIATLSGMGYYAWKHIKQDIAKADQTKQR